MAYVTPKTNWTSSDYYNGWDLNRIEENTEAVRALLVSIGYSIPALTINTSRIYESYDNITSINRIESNLNTLKTSYLTPVGWQSVVTWDKSTAFTAETANRWANSTVLLYEAAVNTRNGQRYAGTFSAGEEVLPQI